MQPVGVALVMERAPISVNFAVAQIDWRETDGTQEGSISTLEHPQVRQLCIRECTACKRKENRRRFSVRYPRYGKSPEVDLGFRVVGRLFWSHRQLVLHPVLLKKSSFLSNSKNGGEMSRKPRKSLVRHPSAKFFRAFFPE